MQDLGFRDGFKYPNNEVLIECGFPQYRRFLVPASIPGHKGAHHRGSQREVPDFDRHSMTPSPCVALCVM